MSPDNRVTEAHEALPTTEMAAGEVRPTAPALPEGFPSLNPETYAGLLPPCSLQEYEALKVKNGDERFRDELLVDEVGNPASDEMIAAATREMNGLADDEDFGEDDQAFADPDIHPLTAEESEELYREVMSPFEEQNGANGQLSEGSADQQAAVVELITDVPTAAMELAEAHEVQVTAETTGEADTSASSSGDEVAEPMVGSEAVPQLSTQALGSMLDESTSKLVALEDFDSEIDDQAFENEWLGGYTEISLEALGVKLLREGKYTAHIDDAGNLLSDPEEYRLAIEIGVKITVCIHRARTKDQKLAFILWSQAGKRSLTYEEQRELRNRTIEVQLRLGVGYKKIAKIVGVHVNTVRNVEKRAAADTNSELGITQRPDGRFNPKTLEKIAKAAELRKEGMADAEIAEIFDTNVETVGKWLKDPPAGAKTKNKLSKKPKTGQGTSAAQPTDMTEDSAAGNGVPELHRRAIGHLGQDAQAYPEWLEAAYAEAREDVEAAGDSVEELLRLSLYGNQLKAATDIRLRKILFAGGEVDIEEAPSGDSCPNEEGAVADRVLLGIPMEITPKEVFVTLSDGSGGVIDNRDNSLVGKQPLVQGKVARFQRKDFNSKRRLANLTLLGRQSFSHAECATAFRPRLANLCSPDTELAGLKAGPKEKEVTE